MTLSFSVENRDALRQRYFEAKDRGNAAGGTHYQTLLGDIPSSSQNQSSRERVSFVGRGFLEAVPKQFSPQVSDLRPSLLSRKLIEKLTQGKLLSLAETTVLDANLAEAVTSHRQYVWYRLGDAIPYESTVIEFCRSFFISRPMREERSIQSYLVLRIIDLTFCRKDLRPASEFVKEVRYLVMCKVQDFIDIRFSELEEELEEVAVDRRDFRKEFVQAIHKIREQAAALWSKLSALEKKPLLYPEEMSFVKQALGLYEIEASYAMALDKVTGKKDYAEELRCMIALGKLYAKKRERQAMIQSVGMLNYALRLIESEDPQYLPEMQIETRYTRRTEILRVLGQVEVQLFRLMGIQITFPQEGIEKAKTSMLTNRKNLQEKRKIIDREIDQLGDRPTPQQITGVHCLIANLMKVFTTQLIEQCIATLGEAPCHYAVVGLGSMAREEMTHYSDLEFAILIEEGAEQHKEYFRNLTYLLHLKVVNLGETILPALNIPCLNSENGIGFVDEVISRGFAFDGTGLKGKGCKIPLGNGITFELIQTPTKMAQYLGRDRNGVDWPEREPHLPMELLNFVRITGDEALCQSYRHALDLELSNHYGEGINLRSYLAREHLVAEDEQQFNPALSGWDKEGQLFKVKQNLYRFPHLSIERLALLSSLQVPSTFARIKELNHREVLNTTASERLQWLICTVLFQRLKVYSHYKAQREFMNPLIKAFLLKDPRLVQKQFALDRQALKILTYIYQILIPFYEAIKAYLKEDSFILRTEVLWDESDFTLGQIAARLLQYEQARAYYLKVQDSSLRVEANRLHALGTVELRLGKEQEALSCFQESLIILEKIHGKEHPDVATILNNIGIAYHSLGEAEEALSFYRRALTIWEKIYGKEHSNIATILSNIGRVYDSLGKTEEALSFHQRALAIWEKIYGKEHPDVAKSLNNIGSAYDSLGKAEETLFFHQKALTILEKIYGEEHPYVATSLNNMGSAYHSLGKAEKALSFHQRALTILEKIHGKEHLIVATSLNNIGIAYHILGKPQEALSFHQRALIIREKIYGQEHPDIAISLNNIGRVYDSLKKTEEALSFHQRALAIWEKIYGKEHPDVAKSLNNIGSAYHSLGKAEEALSFHQRAVTIQEKVYGKEHPDVARSLNNIGTAYHSLGKMQEALSFHQRALTIQEKVYGKEHPDVATSLNNMGSAYHSLGKAEEALSFHQRALAIWEKIHGKEHLIVTTSLNNIGMAYRILGRSQEALSFHQRALIILEKIYGQEHPDVATSLNNIGGAYNSLGKTKEALSFFQRSLTIREKIYGKEHPDVATSLNNIGGVYYSLGKAEEALSYHQRALTIWEKIYGKEHPHVAMSLNKIGNAYHSLGKMEEALFYYQRALVILEKVYGKEHSDVAITLDNIGCAYVSLKNWQEALSYFQKALAIREKVYGKEHPDVMESRKTVIAATYQTIEYPQQKITFVLAAWDRMQKGFRPSSLENI